MAPQHRDIIGLRQLPQYPPQRPAGRRHFDIRRPPGQHLQPCPLIAQPSLDDPPRQTGPQTGIQHHARLGQMQATLIQFRRSQPTKRFAMAIAESQPGLIGQRQPDGRGIDPDLRPDLDPVHPVLRDANQLAALGRQDRETAPADRQPAARFHDIKHPATPGGVAVAGLIRLGQSCVRPPCRRGLDRFLVRRVHHERLHEQPAEERKAPVEIHHPTC